MHGRVKVKTTAEQQEEKRKERQKKLHLFQTGLKKAFDKRKAGEYDDEALAVTGQLLQANPDVYTLWNFRKEIYLHMMEQKSEDEMQELATNELLLTEQCLRTNPKSYGAWHHRSWVMLKMPRPDWDRELYLCGKFLELDERNFHCWDYRRFVCHSAKVEPEKELDFSMKKIETNFSNYSSWHYRSSLLPIVYPSSSTVHSVEEEKLMEEYDLVKNAVFTDPADQSAWFYQRWLLGREEKPLSPVLLCVSKECSIVAVLLTKPIKFGKENEELRLSINGSIIESCWKAPKGVDFSSSVWVHELPSSQGDDLQVSVSVTCDDSSGITCSLSPSDVDGCKWGNMNRSEFFRAELRAATSSVLENELQSCSELQELEPDNKWIVLTSVCLMRALGKPEYEEQILHHLDTLKQLDPMRTNYYSDLRSKFILEDAICGMSGQCEEMEISLASRGLTSLHHIEYFMFLRRLDLSHNNLMSIASLKLLLFVRELVLDDNEISDCSSLQNLPLLSILALNNNNLSSVSDLIPLKSCPKLTDLHISGNPLCNQEGYKDDIRALLPNITSLSA